MANQQTRQMSSSSLEGAAHLIRSVLLQLSGLAGILAFLTQMLSHASLDQSLLTGTIVGGGVYIILLLVDVGVQRIIAAHLESTRQKARAEKKAEIEHERSSNDDSSDSNESSGAESTTPDQSSPTHGDASEPGSPSTDQEMVTAQA